MAIFRGVDADANRAVVIHAVALTFFTLFVWMVASRPKKMIFQRAFGDGAGMLSIHGLMWLPLAVIAGVLFRNGAEGLYVSTAYIFSPEIALREIVDLRHYYIETNGPIFDFFLVGATLVGALEEEFVYRGIALWCLWDRFGRFAAIIITSVFFGLMHVNPIAILAGLLIAAIYIISGRLWVAIIAHATGNLWHPFAKYYGVGEKILSPDNDVFQLLYFLMPSIIIILFLLYSSMKIYKGFQDFNQNEAEDFSAV